MTTVLGYDADGTEIGPQPGPQTILMSCDAEEVFLGGAVGGGKSFSLALDFEQHHQRYGGAVFGLMFRRSVPELGQLIKTFKRVLLPFGWEYRTGIKTFVHPDGAECAMRHCDDEEDVSKYWGFEPTYMGVDEYGDMPETTFDAIQKLRAVRLRSASGVKIRFVATGNPCGKGHKFVKARYIDPEPPFTPFKDKESGHNVIFIPSRMEHNILLTLNDPKYRDRCKSLGPKWLVDALINGDWSKSPEGAIFERPWFQNTFKLSNPPEFVWKICSLDTAFKTTKDSARSACTTWGMTRNADFYLLDGWAGKVEFPGLIAKAEEIYEFQSLIRRVDEVWVEDKASGQSLVQTLKGTTMPVKAISVDGDKLRRAYAVTPYFEGGKVFVPESASWKHEYVEELCAFPAPSGYADYVDSTSQAITELTKVKKRMEKFGNRGAVQLKGSFLGV